MKPIKSVLKSQGKKLNHQFLFCAIFFLQQYPTVSAVIIYQRKKIKYPGCLNPFVSILTMRNVSYCPLCSAEQIKNSKSNTYRGQVSDNNPHCNLSVSSAFRTYNHILFLLLTTHDISDIQLILKRKNHLFCQNSSIH